MDHDDNQDVIELLNKRRKQYEEQIQRIDIALRALRGESKVNPAPLRKSSVAWSSEIDSLFEVEDGMELETVRQKLAERGIGEALDEKHKNTIYSSLMRKVGMKKLMREEGRYWKVKENIESENE